MSIEVLEVGQPTLGELGEWARNEHLLALEAGETMVEHAIRSGEWLLAAKPRVPHGQWLDWLAQNFQFPTAAWIYMRLAYHREAIEASEATSIAQARAIVKGLPRSFRHSSETRDAARVMRKSGASLGQIADALGVSKPTVVMWTDPEKRDRYRKRQREHAKRKYRADRALTQAEQQAAVKKALVKAGEATNEAHRLCIRLNDVLAQARSEAPSKDARLAINEAHAARDKMMDALIKALGVS